MYHVSAQGVDERMINVHFYYSSIFKRTKRHNGSMNNVLRSHNYINI